VPQALLDAFGVLRRAHTDDDALPATALNALRARGLEPFDPAAARLLRTTADGGRAWVVPVRDARTLATPALGCAVPVSLSTNSAARERARARQRARQRAVPATPSRGAAAERARARARARQRARHSSVPAKPSRGAAAERARTRARQRARHSSVPATPSRGAAAERARARARQRARQRSVAIAHTATPAVALAVAPKATAPPSPAPKPAADPQPGLAVVALGGAPSGAGGSLVDLVRGRETVSVASCAGPGKDMLSVSGIVPDGVPAAFLTTADGAAVRADVKDNAYAFVVPAAKLREQRYVVWTGGDGTPHVQPLPAFFSVPATRCATTSRFPVVSPGAFPAGLVLPVRPRVPQHRG
jgi:hypothetical protein